MGGVALVADRFGKQAEERLVLLLAVLIGHAAVAKRREVVHGHQHAGPQVVDQADVVREAVVLGDSVDELSVAVVLGRGIGAAAVDAARDLAVRELLRRVPLEEGAHLGWEAELQKRGRLQRAVANPCARVGPGPRLQHVVVAVDQDVGESGLERVDDLLCIGGQPDVHAPEQVSPARCRLVLQLQDSL